MPKAIDYDTINSKTENLHDAADCIKYYSNIIMRIRRSAFIDWAYQICETLNKGEPLILKTETDSKVDSWDISVSIEKNWKIMKLWYLDRSVAKKVRAEKYTAEVYEPFKLDDSRFWNFWLRILIRLI